MNDKELAEYHISQLKLKRSNLDETLELASDYTLPERGGFLGDETKGDNKRRKVYDTTAIQANRLFASFLNSMLTNPAQLWFDLVIDELESDHEAQSWLDDAQNKIYSVFKTKKFGFNDAIPLVYSELGAFGNGVLQLKYKPGKGIFFKALPLADCWFSIDEAGDCYIAMRRFKLSGHAAMIEFNDKAPDSVKRCLEKEPLKEHEFYHLVYRDYNIEENPANPAVKPYVSLYYFPQEKEIVSKGKMSYMPFFPFRINHEAGFDYGVGNFQYARGDILMANIMAMANIRGTQKMIDPPILMPSDGFVVKGGLGPGDIAYYDSTIEGGVNSVLPLQTGARPDMALSIIENVRLSIRNAWYVNQLQFVSDVNMTATEAEIRKSENMQLLGPVVASLERTVSKVVDCIFNILMFEVNAFAPPPDSIVNREFDVRFNGQLARVQRQQETQSLNRTANDVSLLLQANPQLIEMFDSEKIIRDTSEINGVPTDWLISPDDYAKAKKQAQEMAMAQQTMGAMAEMAPAVKDFASAASQG